MDRFVVRTPRIVQEKKAFEQKEKNFKQATLFSLKRVVVVEDIKRCKALLEIPKQDDSVILDQLQKLDEKIPSREVLNETKIGLTLNKLRKHENEQVATKAANIHRRWKMHFKDKLDKPKIEVRYDNSTNKYRSSSRKLIGDVLHPHQESTILAEAIERCVFEVYTNTSNGYRKHIRGIVFSLRYKDDIKKRLLDKQLTVTDLCKMKKP